MPKFSSVTNHIFPSQLRFLFFPVYLPGILFSAGVSAILPVVAWVVTGLHMPLSATLWLYLLSQTILVAFSGPVGQIVDVINEKLAMTIATGSVVIITPIIIFVIEEGTKATNHLPWQIAFVVLSIMLDFAEAVWGIARSTYVIGIIDRKDLDSAMNLFGVMMRFGKVLGPLLSTIAIEVSGIASAYFVHMMCGLIASMFVWFTKSPTHSKSEFGMTKAERKTNPNAQVNWKTVALVCFGVFAVAIARANRNTLIPTWLHANGNSVHTATIAMAVIVIIEIITFLPSNYMVNTLGRYTSGAFTAILMGLGFLVISTSKSLGIFYIGALLIGAGNGLGAGLIQAIGAHLSPIEGTGRFIGIWRSITNFGALLGALIASILSSFSLIIAIVATGIISVSGGSWFGYLHFLLKENQDKDRPNEKKIEAEITEALEPEINQ